MTAKLLLTQLARADEPDRLVALKQIQQIAQGLSARRSKRGIALHHKPRIIARRTDELRMCLDAHDAKSRHPGLARAEHVALAAQLEIFLRNAEPVLGIAHDVEASLSCLA